MLQRIHDALQDAPDYARATGRPFVTLSYAQSLDGCIAIHSSERLMLSGKESLAFTHQLRAAHDAILVGIGTILADDPRLTVRLASGASPRRLVVDSRLRIPNAARVLTQVDGGLPTLVATTDHADPHVQDALESIGVRVLRLPSTPNGWVDLPALLRGLCELGINSVMVEGGSRVITSFLTTRAVNQMVLTFAPVLVGGHSGVGNLGVTDSRRLPRLCDVSYQPYGADLVMRGDVTWASE